MISYNTSDLSDSNLIVRAYDENDKIVVMLEQEDNVLFINFPNEQLFKQFVFEMASIMGGMCK